MLYRWHHQRFIHTLITLIIWVHYLETLQMSFHHQKNPIHQITIITSLTKIVIFLILLKCLIRLLCLLVLTHPCPLFPITQAVLEILFRHFQMLQHPFLHKNFKCSFYTTIINNNSFKCNSFNNRYSSSNNAHS